MFNRGNKLLLHISFVHSVSQTKGNNKLLQQHVKRCSKQASLFLSETQSKSLQNCFNKHFFLLFSSKLFYFSSHLLAPGTRQKCGQKEGPQKPGTLIQFAINAYYYYYYYYSYYHNVFSLLLAWPPNCPLPKDCLDILNLGYWKKGVYTIHIGPYKKPVDVYCYWGWLVRRPIRYILY